MKLVICTKFHVNRTNCAETRRGGGGPIDPSPFKASCNYFFFEASRVKNGFIKQYRHVALCYVMKDTFWSSLRLKCWKFNKRPHSNKRPTRLSAPLKVKKVHKRPGLYSPFASKMSWKYFICPQFRLCQMLTFSKFVTLDPVSISTFKILKF